MHRIWFNPSITAPVNGDDYYLRLIDWRQIPYFVTWNEVDNTFKCVALGRPISREETLMISDII